MGFDIDQDQKIIEEGDIRRYNKKNQDGIVKINKK
jgi:hypothetical protein